MFVYVYKAYQTCLKSKWSVGNIIYANKVNDHKYILYTICMTGFRIKKSQIIRMILWLPKTDRISKAV